MDVLYFPYTLVSRRGQARKGALISYAGGYADLFPWPEFGDEKLDDQLFSLKNGTPTALATRTLHLATKDGQWRQSKINPTRKNNLLNHYLIDDFSEPEIPSGFKTLKIKMMENYRIQIPFLEKWAEADYQLRLDFNSGINFESFLNFERALSPQLKTKIEFVEDPFPFHFDHWKIANEHLPLACDFEYTKVDWNKIDFPFKTFIYKPARQDRRYIQKSIEIGLNVAVTSSMDHAVGCLHALAEAIELKNDFGDQILDPGCMSWPIYGPSEFAEKIKTNGAAVIDVDGTGIGFDQIFQELAWIQL
jgi:O-succinylbenzoate synthase